MNKANRLLMSAFVLALSVMPAHSGARNASGATPQQASFERSQYMKININIGGKILAASLADNATARDFVSVLPLTLSMKDLFGREKYGDLPKQLSANGPRKNRYEVGDVAYWSPNHQLAVYYKQDGESIPSPGIIPIAKLDGSTEAFNVSGSVKVTIELAK
jgi:hypothetical protein